MIASNHNRCLQGFSRRSRAPRLRSRLDWAEQELVIPEGKYANQKFRMSRQPWTRHLLENAGKWRRTLTTGPKQGGKTLAGFIHPVLYHLFEVGEKVGCGVPNLDMVSDKWREDLLPAIEASRYREFLPRSGRGSKGGTPTRIDFLNGASIRFFGAGGGDKQRAGFTTRVLVVTETDGFDEIGGTSRESTKLSQLEGRTLADPESALIYYECTVSTEDGYTWDQYNKGTASKITCRCRHCLAWVVPDREDLIGWQDAENEIQAGKAAAFACPECGGLWSEDDRIFMNRNSVLVHRGQEVTESGDVVGQPVETNLFSFRFGGFNNLFQPTWFLGEREWLAANAENPDEAATAILQEAWARPTVSDAFEKVDLSVAVVRGSDPRFVGRCSGLEQGELPESADVTTAFIDLGKRFLPWSVECSVDGHIHVPDYGFHETSMPDVVGEEQAIWDALDELTLDLEQRFPLMAGLIDCGKWREIVLTWLKENPGRGWYAAHGLSNYSHPQLGAKGKRLPKSKELHWHWAADNGLWIVNVNPDFTKRQVHSRFLIPPLKESGEYNPGCVVLFGENPHDHTEFAKQVVSESWVTEFKKNKPSRTAMKSFFKKTAKHNHMLDCCAGHIPARSVAMEELKKAQRISLSELQKQKRPQ